MTQRGPAPTTPQVIDVRIVSISLPFDELLLLSLKLIGVQVVLGALVGLVLLAIGVL